MVSVIACTLMLVFAMICIILMISSIFFDDMEKIYITTYYLSMICGLVALFAIPWATG